MKTQNSQYSIDPNTLYTVEGVAKAFQVSVEWVNRQLIYPRQCRYKKQGEVKLILGQWLIEWCERDNEPPNYDGPES